MFPCDRYIVPVCLSSGDLEDGEIDRAVEQEILRAQGSFGFNWHHLWIMTDPDWQVIVKLVYGDRILGLMRYGFQPWVEVESPDDIRHLQHQYLRILHLETVQGRARQVEPLGRWLLWYAASQAMKRCVGNRSGTILALTSRADAVSYYEGKIGMENLGKLKVSPNEEGYAFRFSKFKADAFCQRQEREFGTPRFCP